MNDQSMKAAMERGDGPMLAADGTPLKKSLARALRMQKIRALLLVAPLLIFVLLTFLAPIADMLFRSVENQIVSETLPGTTATLDDWEAGEGLPPEPVWRAFYFDLFLAAEAKEHTRLGSRLNYEFTGMSSLFRGAGRGIDDIGEDQAAAIIELDPRWEEGGFWHDLMSGTGDADVRFLDARRDRLERLTGDRYDGDIGFSPGAAVVDLLPLTARAYTDWALYTVLADGDAVIEVTPWEAVPVALFLDLRAADAAAVSGYDGPGRGDLFVAMLAARSSDPIDFRQSFIDLDEDFAIPTIWETIQTYSNRFTPGYFLNAVDLQLTPDGVSARDAGQRIYIVLFQRTMFMSLLITFSCILLGYPVAWILANLPMRVANMLMILVLLPFWTSLLVRTSAWKVMLQQQGVINDTLVWLGLVDDAARLVMINNQFGTIVAMTHILLPFMILPLYSVMQTIPPSYVRAAKSLGATNMTAFWRVYFPQSVPGIGAGSILVFILAIGYYITPEIVGGTKGVFISNRIAYHISASLNWGLGAALGTILLAAVLILYWAYDKVVGIDNVKLGG